MTAGPRIPYGLAKRIVKAMRRGDTVMVRPQYVVTLHNAARRLGLRLRAVAFRRDGRAMYRMTRISLRGESGRRLCRRPARDNTTGRWIKDSA
jgi:hypothetical protein